MAEALSSVFLLVKAVTTARQAREQLRHKPTSRVRKLSSHCYLNIWDVSENAPQDGMPTLLADIQAEDEVAKAITDLPDQKLDTIRVFLYESDKLSNEGLFACLHCAGSHQFKSSPDLEECKSGANVLMSQCRGVHLHEWYHSQGWYFLNEKDMIKTKPPNPNRIREELRELKKDMKELIGQPEQQWATAEKHIRLEEKDRQIRVFILCKASYDRNKVHSCISTKHFASTLHDINSIYLPMRTKENIKPLFLLQYHHANMLCLAEFLRQVSSRYALRRKKDIDPRQSKLRRWNLEAIIHDVELYRHFSSTSADLQASISLLSDVVLTLDENARDNNQHSKPDLRILRAELSCCCKDIKMQLDRLTGDVEQDLKFLSISRELSQSRNVQTLTILATVFLPLSLSAGMLSMQYRLHDLGDRLYDFVGIVVVLGAIVALLLLLISMHNLGLEIEGRFRKHAWYNLWVRPSLIMSQLLGHYLVGLLMLSSFIVGMFKDVRLGGKILGWGLLAVIGTPIALVLAVTLSYLVVAMLVPGVQSSFRYLTRPFKNKEQKQQHKKTQSHSEEHRLEEGIELEVATEHI